MIRIRERRMNSATLKVKFVSYGTRWIHGAKVWESWLEKMCSVHQSTWKDAGIYEAIMSSVYQIKRDDALIFELASRWCSETSTFVFPWGEATLTLEDMLVLGGFSPLGVSALSSVENDAKLLEITERLEQGRMELVRTRAQSALHGKWMEKFKDCGSDLEHAAFLSLWLSRFVFPSSMKGVIKKHVFPVAAWLSRGIKIALGPVILAMLYRDLTTLAKSLQLTQLVAKSGEKTEQLDLFALFHLVQIWAWERFPKLKPVPNCMYSGENFPKLARWSNLTVSKDKDVRSAIDSAGNSFAWCPYGAYSKREGTGPESFGRCIKASELVGLDSCIERYQPRLVARQFGLDQDIPSDNVDKAPMTARDDKWQKTSSRVKVEKSVDCPPGFSAQIEVIEVDDSDSDFDSNFDSDEDCRLKMTEITKLHVPKTGRGAVASPDVAKDYACFMDKTEESERAEKEQKNTNLVSPHSNHESNEAVDFLKVSVNETRGDKGKVADTKHDDKEGRSTGHLQNEHAMNCDAESYTIERSIDFHFDLEARISRLENIVYPHIKELEASK